MSGALSRPTQIRRVVGGLAVVGGVSLAGFTAIEQPLVGVGVYVLAVAGAVAVQARAPTPVFDERDETVSQEAAAATLTIFGLGSAGVFPALTVAWGLDLFEWQAWSTAIALFVSVLFLTYSGLLLVFNQRR